MSETAISTDAQGIAIGGYDPVAYFTADRATIGSAEHSVEWSDATWRFANAENAEKFAANPSHFAPQFGGRCAFGASMGKTAEASPESWRVIDGKLCLMKSGAVRAISKLVTGKISKTIAAQ